MRHALMIWFIMFSTADIPLLELRKLYYSSTVNKKSADEFLDVVNKVKSPDPVYDAYRAMALLVQSKFLVNPYSKLKNFRSGRDLLDVAAKKSPGSLEIRFMRFSVQTSAPSFLGYNNEIAVDKALILNGWKKLTDADLKSRVRAFMVKSGYCNENEKSIFR